MHRRAGESRRDVHHRIPLQWAHLFPGKNPNRFENLFGIKKNLHNGTKQLTTEWKAFRRKLSRDPTAEEVERFAEMMDIKYISHFIPLL